MKNAADLNKEQKYFFNQNIFDDGSSDTVAPVYTAKDIEDARRKGIAEGRGQATKEQEEARAHRLEQALGQIQVQMGQLLAAEKTRHDHYEHETLALLLLALRKLFPMLDKAIGLDQLKNFVAQTLKNQDGHPHMTVLVSPEILNEIKDYIDNLKLAGSEIDCTVQSDEKLTASSCSVLWEDGGALRNPEKLATEIQTAVQDILAGRGAKGHDKKPAGDGDNS
ncbi:MAG: hypothetical protein ACT4OY_05100 [Alphaproteobacteria bacterium]